MSTQDEQAGMSAEQVEEQVRRAVDDGENIARDVERIAREAMQTGLQEFSRMKTVMESIGRGAAAGAGEQSDTARQAVNESFEGLQNALLHSFEQAKLAAEEQVTHAKSYYEQELKARLTEMRQLEAAMLDSLSAAAKSGTHTGARALNDLVAHARHSGTRVGSEVNQSMQALARTLPEALRETALAGLGAATEATARAADAASGVLGGLAETLHEKTDSKPNDPGQGNNGQS